ncbi:BTB/POZ domain-containing protein KCTD16-like [Argiope bruennichi]|uniref:BTB/POZ domain-containing protein KCTD16 n=1 Tax=Argiope bruennichi TaxID=94029 RepID=A0A8T0FYV4_ARGBR|nr:BTB/POZ domain-containing protein KCTD16-like [Argiope bruennichi]KAF8795445.1 BTB/POZ domain-containing protein KCTD16 [Argiope bruennichi]
MLRETSETCVWRSMESEGSDDFPSVVELNVGGVLYTTSLSTLTKDTKCLLGQIFTGKEGIGKDAKGRYFVDRDGVLFRYVLDFLRNQKLVLPENFHEKERLKNEAEYFNMADLIACVNSLSTAAPQPVSLPRMSSVSTPTSPGGLMQATGQPGYLTIGYRGSFAFGRDGLADVKFRKLTRILVCGRVTLCREVFGDTLNESRDPDRVNENRYTARFFLKHNFLEQAFDNLQESGFRCVAAAGSGTSGSGNEPLKPGIDFEENRWNHYNEFVFVRP